MELRALIAGARGLNPHLPAHRAYAQARSGARASAHSTEEAQ
jgi:hypothetical protein